MAVMKRANARAVRQRLKSLRSAALTLALVAAALFVPQRWMGAQTGLHGNPQALASAGGQGAAGACSPIPGTVAISSLTGQPIREVDVSTAPPRPLPGPAALLDNLHARTREATVRRRLLFAAGDSVNPLRIAESLRRLRGFHYLADVAISAARCREGGVVLAVATRDAWSTRPTLKVQGSGTARVGLEERNLLGTGRSVSAYLRSDFGRLGVGVSYTDPWLLDSRWQASVAHNAYRDGGSWEGALQTRQRSVFDRWHAELSALHSVRLAPVGQFGVTGDSVYRDAASVLVGRRLSASPDGVTSLLAGAELDRATVVAGPTALIVGPAFVRRTFVGLDIGATRHTARYTANDWLVGGGRGSARDSGMPASAVAQLPVGFEAEGLMGLGRDLASGGPALHVDLWTGRIWTRGANLVLSTDVWASGFRIGREWSAGSLRGVAGAFRPASHGLWSARLSIESLADPDPDVRALAAVDPILRAVSPRVGLAETAVGLSLERSRRLIHLGHGYALDGALFAASSTRWEAAARAAGPTADMGAERLYIGVLGAGVLLSPLRFGRSTVRFDIGVPVLHSSGVRGRPYFGLSIVPAITSARRRDGGITPW
jgi:hypothetical protein